MAAPAAWIVISDLRHCLRDLGISDLCTAQVIEGSVGHIIEIWGKQYRVFQWKRRCKCQTSVQRKFPKPVCAMYRRKGGLRFKGLAVLETP